MSIKLTAVRGHNVKGRDFDHVLRAVMVFMGRNAVGKTAILDGIRLGLLGYLPRLGKQAGATWLLAGAGNEMEVALDTADTTLSHLWRPTKAGASYEGALPWATPVVLLDTHEYFEATAAGRIDYVFGLTDPVTLGYSDGTLLRRFREIEVVPAKLCGPIVQELTEKLGASIAGRGPVSVQTWLGKEVDKIKVDLKCAQSKAKILGGQIGALRAAAGACPPDVSAALGVARAELAALDVALGGEREREAQRVANATRLLEIGTALDSLPADFSAIDSLALELAGLVCDSAESLKSGVMLARERLADAESYEKQLAGSVLGFSAGCVCLGCGTEKSRLGLPVLERLAREAAAVAADRRAQLKGAKGLFDAALAADERAVARREELSKSLDLLRQQRQSRQQLTAEKKRLAPPASACEATPLAIAPGVEAGRAAVERRVNELTEAQRVLDVYKSDKERREALSDESMIEECRVEVLKLALKAIVSVQSDLVEVAFSRLLEKARLFTDGILRSPLVYRDGDVGRMEGERFVSWRTFSGTEEALAMAGLAVALAQQAPCRVVLIDEMGRFGMENKRRVLSRMVALEAAGHIDHFFGCDVVDDRTPELKKQSLAALAMPGVEIVEV